MPSKSFRKPESQLKENVPLQAVIVVDDFENQFEPLTCNRSKAMVPLLNRPIVDHTLQFLQVRGVRDAFVFCSKQHEIVSKHIKNRWAGSKMEVHVLVSETYQSLGDVLRDADRQAKIKSDFILIRGDVVGNINLISLVTEHRNRRLKDKGALMTCVYRKTSNIGPADPEDICVFLNSESKILFYRKGLTRQKNVKVPLQIFKENSSVHVLNQLKDTHIAICSVGVAMLYADNADYQNNDDFIRGTLDNEDILGNSIYVHLTDGYSSRVSNPPSYDEVSRDLICRWNHPFVPDKMDCLMLRKNNIFLESSEQLNLSVSIIEKNVVVGTGTLLGSGVSISDSVIGRNCRIGNGVVLNRAYVWDNVVIEENCRISQSILADFVSVKKGTTLCKGCVVCDGVTVGPNVVLESSCIRLPHPSEKASDTFGSSSNGVLHDPTRKSRRWGMRDVEIVASDSEAGTLSDSDVENMDYGDEGDYVKSFYAEVLDNFKRGLAENISSDNLILEVNSMKHAYNIRINEVNTMIIQAMLEVPDLVNISGEYGTKLLNIIQIFLPLVRNYIRDSTSQLDCLNALEEFHLHKSDQFTISVTVKVIKLLYDMDVLDEDCILKWFSEPSELSELIQLETTKEEQRRIRKEQLLVRFINWLKEAEEESESD